MLTVTLSWPEPSLWPNSRRHWSQRARATREARFEAWVVTTAALVWAAGGGSSVWPLPVSIAVIGHKPNGRARDLQNLQSALKGAVDGIADAIGVNDKHFVLTTRWGADDPPRGSVTVTVTVGT